MHNATRTAVAALTLAALFAAGCAGARPEVKQPAAPAQAAAPATEQASLGRIDDPEFLFSQRGKPEKRLVVKALAYTGCSPQKKRSTRGAWGDVLDGQAKAVAVSPDLLEQGLDRGAVIRIEGLPGEYRVMDVMHDRHERTIDIFYGADRCGALKWGSRTLSITFD